MTNRTIILIDGENLIIRFQDMLAEGRDKAEQVVHDENRFLWNPNLTLTPLMDIVRASYYITVTGDENKILGLKQEISSAIYYYRRDGAARSEGYLCPHIFKKDGRSKKSKSVDINITIDAFRHTYNDSMDILFLLSGDGDFIAAIEEVMRQGKKVFLGAFSKGLNPNLQHIADRFIDLDRHFFR